MMRGTILAMMSMALSATCPARAADITLIRTYQAGALVGVEGDLELADGEKFASMVRPFGNAIVLFNSRGGSLLAGLRIGQQIRSRGFGALVPDGSICASACALAWLGGKTKYLGPKGRLGFHAAYMTDGTSNTVSGSANALVGAYLNRLGLSDEAIYELTDAAPDQVRWLDVAAANRLGIRTEEFRLDDEPVTPIITAPRRLTPQQRAISTVEAYFNAGSSDAASALAWLSSNYSDTISFYGKQTPLTMVLQQKRAFVTRWPERLYIPVDKATAVACAPDGTTCRVSGTVQFECRSYGRGAYSAGLASFALAIDLRGPRAVVIEESGRVIQRR
jgi:hypothetical protein